MTDQPFGIDSETGEKVPLVPAGTPGAVPRQMNIPVGFEPDSPEDLIRLAHTPDDELSPEMAAARSLGIIPPFFEKFDHVSAKTWKPGDERIVTDQERVAALSDGRRGISEVYDRPGVLSDGAHIMTDENGDVVIADAARGLSAEEMARIVPGALRGEYDLAEIEEISPALASSVRAEYERRRMMLVGQPCSMPGCSDPIVWAEDRAPFRGMCGWHFVGVCRGQPAPKYVSLSAR